MKTIRFLALAAGVGLVVWLAGSGYAHWRRPCAQIQFPKIDRHPAPRVWPAQRLARLPEFKPDSPNPFQVDLRSRDVSALDLREALPTLLNASFDAATRWPAADRLPPEFDRRRILELGRNPGLGLRRLHAQGITGRGVGIAIIDQIPPTDHPEYAARLRLYEEADDISVLARHSSMHGAALASFAVGNTCGVAPEADLYFIATDLGTSTPGGFMRHLLDRRNRHAGIDFAVLARCVRRVLRLNAELPPDRKIRVVAMAIGWPPDRRGYAEIKAAAEEARAAGLLVVSSSIETVHGFKFHGLGRAPLADPDDFASYEPGQFWAQDFRRNPEVITGRLLVPMDSRTAAGWTRDADYAFYRHGGWSWSIPYIAGAYALAAQVKPAITPDEFWAAALRTGRTIELKRDSQSIPFGPILDPEALVRALRSEENPEAIFAPSS